MTEADVAGADALRGLIGWNQRPEHWRLLLKLEPLGCFVAEREGKVVGSVTSTSYGQALAWIGMMLVHPECQRQGIGTRLMRQALAYLRERGVVCVKLDATPAGFPVYQRLGFVPEWALTRHQRPAVSGGGEGNRLADVRELTEADWPAIERLDAEAFGVSRAELIRSLSRESRKAVVWPAQGTVAGWGALRPGPKADYLGPIICTNKDGANSLARALLGLATQPVFWDVPDQNEDARSAAKGFGFTPLRPLTRMRLGPENVRSDPKAQFAIADPSVG